MRWFGLLACGLALAACAPAPIIVYDKQDVSVTRFSTDYSACLATAESQAPVIIQNQTSYGATVGVGTGWSSGWYSNGTGVGLSVDTRRVDINEGRRLALMQSCMSRKGYTPKQIPGCSTDVQRQTVVLNEYRQPAITQQSCGAQLQGLGPVILSP
ncbi:hypothetical protein [Tropicimonas sp. S265A]|uniref:hypothetical protein n=1 Tax=Tropicimonas sp. S265A TaxID=3415134 RepID=UPI003C7DB5ED